jgi:hypothetical protein
VFKRMIVYPALLLLPPCAFAAESGNPAIRAAVERFIDAQDISGAVTVVAANDKLLAVDTIGLARSLPMAVGCKSLLPLTRAFLCLLSIPEYLFADDSFRCFIEIRIQSS